MKYAIQYHYPGTVNGQPVGIVYALDIKHLSGGGAWSYVKESPDATLFDSEDAASSEAVRHAWPDARVVEVPA